MTTVSPTLQVRSLWRYPIKSFGGEQLERAHVDELGVDGDRRFAVRDSETGAWLTARREPRLLFASAAIVDGALAVRTEDGPLETVTGVGPAADRTLSDWLGRPVTLVAAGPVTHAGGTYEAPADAEHEAEWVAWTGPGGALHDSTRTRISLMSTTTLGSLDARRFRPNVILDGAPVASPAGPTDPSRPAGSIGAVGPEDAWVERSIRVGADVVLDVRKHIDRCVMVNRAQPGLPADRSVLRQVVAERSNRLGIGALVTTGGTIAVGDPVQAT